MSDFNFLSVQTQWPLLSWMGINHPFFSVVQSTVIATWAVIACICITLFFAKRSFNDKGSIGHFVVVSIVKFFMNLTQQTLGSFQYNHFSFITTIFFFILYCNIISLVPFLEEPTADLNTTLALGIISFFYINIYSIKKRGFKHYIAEFFQPFFLMFPLHVVGKLASIISISFRLYGNLFGGAVITKIFMGVTGQTPTAWYLYAIPLIGSFASIVISVFFCLFEGFIQAFVFAMLSLTYLSTELASEE